MFVSSSSRALVLVAYSASRRAQVWWWAHGSFGSNLSAPWTLPSEETSEEIDAKIVISFANVEYVVLRRQISRRSSRVKHGRGQSPVEPAIESAFIFFAMILWFACLATFVFTLSDVVGDSSVENNNLSEPTSVLQ